MRGLWYGGAALVVAAALAMGCAQRRGPDVSLERRFTEGRPAAGAPTLPGSTPGTVRLAEVAALAPRARAEPFLGPARARTLESADHELAGALAALARRPTAENHLAVADAYFEAGILDQAYDHYAEVARLAPADAAAHDQMARIWLRWRFPQFGLADAHRAVFLAPGSPIPVNTLGTLLLATGRRDAAQQAFERALRLDGGAAYALQNLCALLEAAGEGPETAATACALALRVGPMTTTARAAPSGRGMTPWPEGRPPDSPDTASSASDLFGLGVEQLATRRYGEAASTLADAERCLRGWRCPSVPQSPGAAGRGGRDGVR